MLIALLSACGGGGGGSAAPGSETASATDQQAGAPAGAAQSRAVISSAIGSVVAVANTVLIAQVSAVDVKVKSLIKASETRVSRTVFDYVFRVELVNAGGALTNVKATVTATGDGTTIIDGSIVVGDMAAGQTTTPSDTITLRHDRTKAFDSAALVWGFTSETGGGSTVPGILLPGPDSARAEDAIPEVDLPRTAEDLATAVDTNGADTKYNLRQLQAVISATATVGQVNAALQTVGGRIVWAMKRNRVVTIQVPNNGGLAELRAIAATLEASIAFNSVSLYVVPTTSALPPEIAPAVASAASSPILHQIGARVPSIWNVNNLDLKNPNLEIIVADFFGNGKLTQLGGQPVAGILEPSSAYRAATHGYHVLGILAGDFGGAGSVGSVTGSFVRSVPINVIDLVQNNSWERIRTDVAKVLRAKPTTRFVVNFSLGYCKIPDPATKQCVTLEQAKRDAEAWRVWANSIYVDSQAKFFDWPKQVLVSAAAGNESGASAKTSTPFAAATLLPDSIGKGDNFPILRWPNAMVVEARKMVSTADAPAADCRDASYSNIDGTIAGIGTGVYSFLSPTNAGFLQGTSMAAPQVAGIAALMAAVRPEMYPADIKARIENVRFTSDACGDAPMIDAYAALLSLDVSMTDAPVRQALLRASVTSPGPASKQLMTYDDVKLFLKAYFPAAYPPVSPEIVQPAFSRYDLNGDGYDGDVGEVAKVAPFDMQFDGLGHKFVPDKIDRYTSAGNPLVNLDEARATDFQILCYYINSPLFDMSQKQTVDNELRRLSLVMNRRLSCNDPLPSVMQQAFWFSDSGTIPCPESRCRYQKLQNIVFQCLTVVDCPTTVRLEYLTSTYSWDGISFVSLPTRSESELLTLRYGPYDPFKPPNWSTSRQYATEDVTGFYVAGNTSDGTFVVGGIKNINLPTVANYSVVTYKIFDSAGNFLKEGLFGRMDAVAQETCPSSIYVDCLRLAYDYATP